MRTLARIGGLLVLQTMAVAASALLLSSCSSSSDTSTVTGPSSDAKCALQAQIDKTAFAAGGGSGTVQITTNRECEWSARSDAAWVSVTSSSSGQGAASLQFAVAANATPSARSAGITVNDQHVQLSQEGKACEYTVSSNHENVDGAGGDRTIDVRATPTQCGWTAASGVSWITITSGRQGTGNGSVGVHVDPAAGPPRSGTITVAGQTIQIDQGTGCSYAIDTANFTVEPGGGDREVHVTAPAGCAWTSESRTSWLTITSGSSGSGAGTVSFRAAGTDGPERTGALVVAGRTVLVTQMVGCSVSISPTSINANAQGGANTVQVETGGGCPWSAASGTSWISLTTSANGSGRGSVQFSVAANTGVARTGTLTVAGQTVTVAQANGCVYSVSPPSVDIPGNGGPGSASITTGAGCPWSASSGASWITLAAASGSGPGQLAFSVAENLNPPRNGSLTVAGQTIAVTQASPCTWIFAPPSATFSNAGGFGSVLVVVTGPCSWNTSSTVDWIRVTSPPSSSGNGLVQFIVSPNAGQDRIGIVTVAGQNYLVKQAGQ